MILKKILLMRLLNLSKYLYIFFIFFFSNFVSAEEDSVDIWKKNKNKNLEVSTEEKLNQTIEEKKKLILTKL